MGPLEQAKSALIRQFETLATTDPQASIVHFQTKVESDVDLLVWMKGQPVYPQFYLRFRDEPKTVAAVGKVRSFSDVDLAQQFIQEHDFPLVGGLQFQGESQFILPQVLMEQQNGETVVSVFVEPNDLNSAKTILNSFERMTALLPLNQLTIENVESKANQGTWCDWVKQALTRIRQGELTKLVLANETVFHIQGELNGKDFLAVSQAKNSGCYHFLWADNAQNCFVGSTPERLFARDNRLLFTEALAGTAPVSDNPSENNERANWLLNDEKNLNENWLVVEDISQNISHLVEQITVDDVALKPLRKVQHLIRKMQAKLTALCTDADLLKAIHPTAAVSGLPQQQAKKALAEIETFDRRWYAGTLGVMSQHLSEFCVTIRSAFIEENRVRVFAGAGIVEGSQPVEEWL
ncbi:isochorismate synthase, partial [Haemophilus sp.]|uniref:isochorismate synthase n=1 Tax=Haemophilus sp. TaxID=740 RepID=UPI003AEF2EF8